MFLFIYICHQCNDPDPFYLKIVSRELGTSDKATPEHECVENSLIRIPITLVSYNLS